ncbi:hypothetical protein M5K25_001564 [Dendrobium thyrsiflorum]|uniref:Uncharacterized protein n=1 Tax=Dendrobium thyrsiflorum TaxID=117978 RepID=A0ABD0VQE0_DENTH
METNNTAEISDRILLCLPPSIRELPQFSTREREFRTNEGFIQAGGREEPPTTPSTALERWKIPGAGFGTEHVRSPTSVSGPAEVRASLCGPAKVLRQMAVQRKSGRDLVVWCQVMFRRNFGVRRWSGGSSTSCGGPAELRRQVVVRWRYDISWWSSETLTSCGGTKSLGGPVELRRQAVVRRNFGVRWWSGGTLVSGDGPAESYIAKDHRLKLLNT